MAVINVPGQAITANVEKDSPATTLPAGPGITAAVVRLTDPSNQWTRRTGNVTIWGVQSSADGINWSWLVFSRGIPFGTVEKDGGLPSVAITADQVIAAGGNQLRLAVLTDSAITLGATITTTP
jgi:hypothetical protein